MTGSGSMVYFILYVKYLQFEKAKLTKIYIFSWINVSTTVRWPIPPLLSARFLLWRFICYISYILLEILIGGWKLWVCVAFAMFAICIVQCQNISKQICFSAFEYVNNIHKIR